MYRKRHHWYFFCVPVRSYSAILLVVFTARGGEQPA